MKKPAIAVLALLALAGCGARADLKPRVGQQLPPTPYGRPDQLTAHELLNQNSQSRPGNSIELRVKSEPRADDPFDLPPAK